MTIKINLMDFFGNICKKIWFLKFHFTDKVLFLISKFDTVFYTSLLHMINTSLHIDYLQLSMDKFYLLFAGGSGIEIMQ